MPATTGHVGDHVSPMQPTLFDIQRGERAKQEGAALAAGSDRAWPWKEHAMAVLTELAGTGKTFTSDDLVARVGLPDEGVNRNNAVGAIFIAAAKQGLIVKVGYKKARRRQSHARMVAVWTGDPGRDF